MKKQNVINLIKYHVEKNEIGFRNEAINIAREFDSIGDDQLAEYIMLLVSQSSSFSPQAYNYEGKFLKVVDVRGDDYLYLPSDIYSDINGVINAINHKIGANKFLFEGLPGSGKTEAVKNIARLLERTLYRVDFDYLIDSKLGETNKNLSYVFEEINHIPHQDKVVVLFDEIDAIALDRINSNDVREMGRVTSTMLRELDRLTDMNKDVVLIATTNLFSKLDKALVRRFDATINFDRYEREDLIQIANFYLSSYIKKIDGITKDERLFNKILKNTENLPYPGELKNIIKTSLAFSDSSYEFDYLKRLYSKLIKNIDSVSLEELNKQGFTIREIEKLKGESKSSISRKISRR